MHRLFTSSAIAKRPHALLIGSLLALALSLAIPSGKAQTAKVPEGQKLFLARCAPCHGVNGQGGSGDPAPLTGTLSKAELANFIKKSMPPGPKKCPARDAPKIADYIYDAFFSPLAQERNRPARIKLVRLTVQQFRNAVTDLFSGFHRVMPWNETHGLHAEYFKGRSTDAKNRVIDRVDPDVRFDFGTDGPEPKLFDPNNFTIVWQGSVYAPDTGEYDFSIHAKHSVSLYLNGSRFPTVDGEVRSAGDADPHGTIKLLGGRCYPLYMTFKKATQGVEDATKKGIKPTTAYVTLNWRRPKHVEEPIPTQFLFKEWLPKSFVLATPFPPDDRSTGYERGDSVSKEWDDAVTAAAFETAEYATNNLAEISGVPEAAPDRVAKLKDYCVNLLGQAFRRPITDAVKRTYVDKQFALATTPESAIKRVIVLAIKSPRFLYRELGVQDDAYARASELSFGLWDTLPDPELTKAASTGGLASLEGIRANAARLASDRRAWSKLREFLLLWLKVDEVPDIVKNPKTYPGFDAQAASDLRTSLELFLENTAWSKSSDFRDVMLSDVQFMNGRLAKLYGVDLPPDAPFLPVPLDAKDRAGVLTQPYLLARFAYLDSSSPIHRGVLIERNMLGRVLSPPPANFVPLSASARPDLTTRERVSLQTKPQFCNNCHGIINSLGFTLERFDAIGRLRDTDNGKPVDCSGSYQARNGQEVKFSGAKDIAQYLATGEDSRDAFVEKLFVNVVKQPPMAYGPESLHELQQSFVKNHYSIRDLLVDTVVKSAYRVGKRVGKL